MWGMARAWLELRQQIENIEREIARNGAAPNSDLMLQLTALVEEALNHAERRAAALESAFDDLDARQMAFDNSRFFRVLRWPGRFLLDWKGRLGQLLLHSPLHAIYRRMARPTAAFAEYGAWIERERAGAAPAAWYSERARQLLYRPLISLILPVCDPEREWLEAALDSVTAQTYPSWELCICDDGSAEPWVAEYLAQRAAADPRIHLTRGAGNRGISAASNQAAAMAAGDYAGFLDQDDVLAPHALHYVAEALQEGAPDLLYSDEDRLDSGERRIEPIFKPGWSPDLLLNGMYLGHFVVVRRAAAEAAGWLRSECDGAQDYDLALRVTDGGGPVRHIPRVLYHWRKHAGSTSARASAKPYTHAAGLKALRDTVARRQYDASCENGSLPNTYRVRWRVAGHPLASIVICSRTPRLLRRCLKSIRAGTAYDKYEFVIVEHGIASGIDAIRVPYAGVFDFARMNNAGAAAANGEILIFLNDDVEPISPDWLDWLVMHAQRANVGVAGARLLYPSGAIQHAGLAIGVMKNGVGHICRDTFGIRHWHWLPFSRNVSAVTAACLAIRKEVFQELAGFDPAFPVNYNDVDLCLRARQHGYQVMYEPAAVLRHYECHTRRPGVRYCERVRWRERWGHWLDQGDPFYNPNLAHDREDASLGLGIPGREDNSR